MNAVTEATLTILAACTSFFALMTAGSRYVPWLTRIVCLVVGLIAGVYAAPRIPVLYAILTATFLAMFLLLQAVLERPNWTRRTATGIAQVGRRLDRLRDRTARGTLRVALWVLTWRREWAEAVIGVGLSALAEACESCGRGPGNITETFSDGTSFRVCGLCAAAARRAGRRSFL